jgi:hypothetical protein
MMYEVLYQYFIQHKKLAIPGLGTFLMERKPAVIDFVNKQISAPYYPVTFQAPVVSPGINFFEWLGDALHISHQDAMIRFNDFVFDIKKQINDGSTIEWNAMGSISKDHAGEVKFASAAAIALEKPVAIEKVLREKSEHMVRVGEDQKTSAEMTEMLNQPVVKKSRWWITALVVGLLALAFIGWNFYENGVDVSSTSNNEKLVPLEASATYQTLQ